MVTCIVTLILPHCGVAAGHLRFEVKSPFEAFLRLCLSTDLRRNAFRQLIQALLDTLSCLTGFT